MKLISEEERKEMQRMYDILFKEMDEMHSYFYTNPPQDVPILERRELFELGELSPLIYYNPIITADNISPYAIVSVEEVK